MENSRNNIAMNMNKKMNWFIEAYQNKNLDYIIANTGETHGHIIMPTGAGKSGVMYADMIHHIDNMKEGEKLSIVMASPILRLAAQTANDGIDVIKGTHPDMVSDGNFMFYVVSSANGRDYDCRGLNADCHRISEISKFKESKNAKVAIFAACYDSLPKLAKKIDELKEFSTVAVYLDEAHLMISDARDEENYALFEEIAKLSGKKLEKKEKWESLVQLCKADYLYGLTATPDKNIMAKINEIAGRSEDHAIINVRPQKLIKENVILPVKTFISGIENDSRINGTICKSFMDKVKAENPNIAHKILVTCSTTDHLKGLRDELMTMGYTVFSTNAKEGGKIGDKDDVIDIDEVEFINEVDSYDGDCFVLHIRQLRQGIDIKTLTDGIIYNATRVNDGVKKILIQTIGRVLRPAAGERGMAMENRTKKCGNILFVLGWDDFYGVYSETLNFLMKYYGRDGIKAFTHDIKADYGEAGKNKFTAVFGDSVDFDGDDITNFVIDEMRIRMEDYVKEKLAPKHAWLVRIGAKDFYNHAVLEMKSKYAHFSGEFNTCDLFSDSEFMEYITELFAKYDIID